MINPSQNGAEVPKPNLRAMGDRVEALLRELGASPNLMKAREKAEELTGVLVQLYGSALSRVLEIVYDSAGAARTDIFDRLCADDFVASVMILHGLHPVSLDERVHNALESVRPYLKSHEGNVEILRIAEGVVYLRMAGSCDGCPSSAMTVKVAIERAIFEACPEITEVRAEGVDTAVKIQRKASDWVSLESLPQLRSSKIASSEIEGMPVLFLHSGSELYAYRNQCAACLNALSTATVEWPLLTCFSCGQQYDVLRAGRALEGGKHNLEPLPLVLEKDRLRLAIPVTA
ncbi:MAG: NifU family protein [Candidatus Eremiobacteraeota bacterium]|nr:NifU family protein [Candidatus Eremiobacteraeota bacterium]